jgi:YggT family protein
MFVFRYLLEPLVEVVILLLDIYMYIIIARVLLSWVNPDPFNPIVRFLYNVTEPVLGWVRRHVPIVFGGLDLSPILVMIAIAVMKRVLINTFGHLASLIC